jgi:tetratricopeptide (TPR) repeat protein
MGDRESYREGMASYHAGRYEDVIRHLTPLASRGEGAIRLMSRFYLGQAYYRLAVRLFDQRHFRDASNHFRNAAQVNPSGGGVARFLAACCTGNKGLEEAARRYAEGIERHPSDAALRVKLALAQWKLGQPGEAITTLKEGMSACPVSADLHYQLGVMAAAEERFEEARGLFEKAISIDPAHASAHERLAQCHGVAGRTQVALEHLRRAHELDPGSARVAMQISILAGAIADPHSRPKIAPQPGGSAVRYDQADIDRLGEVIAADPEFVDAFLRLPSTDVDQELFTVLRATLEKSLEKHPEFADLHYHCGQVYHRLGKDRNAIRYVEQAVQLNPRYVEALILLARLYGETDAWMNGVDRLQQAVEAGADYPDVHYLVGQLYQKGNQPEQARRAYSRALGLKSDYRAAREALDSLAV